jgi:hypothetical protein
VLKNSAPDCPVHHRTVSGAPGPYKCQPATLGKTQARSAIIHRTVRCATGLSGVSVGNGYLACNGWLCKVYSTATVNSRSQSSKVRGHRTVQCCKETKLQRSTELRNLTVGWRDSAPETEQCQSGGAPDCPVRPSPAASPTATLVVEGYKYSNHHNSKHLRFLNITFNTRALAFTPRHNSKDQSLSKSQIHLKHLVTCEGEILCSFELLLLGLHFFFLILFPKWLVIKARDT